MPKMKTKRSAAKRFKLTGGNKVRRNKAYASHCLLQKSAKRKRNLRQKGTVATADEPMVRKMICA
ncbi:50S ribosomal protein L35 [candidate division KSB1 bacterium]|nr:50S ribosomal protein L35 [candidate division KSB1 bacterium]